MLSRQAAPWINTVIRSFSGGICRMENVRFHGDSQFEKKGGGGHGGFKPAVFKRPGAFLCNIFVLHLSSLPKSFSRVWQPAKPRQLDCFFASPLPTPSHTHLIPLDTSPHTFYPYLPPHYLTPPQLSSWEGSKRRNILAEAPQASKRDVFLLFILAMPMPNAKCPMLIAMTMTLRTYP